MLLNVDIGRLTCCTGTIRRTESAYCVSHLVAARARVGQGITTHARSAEGAAQSSCRGKQRAQTDVAHRIGDATQVKVRQSSTNRSEHFYRMRLHRRTAARIAHRVSNRVGSCSRARTEGVVRMRTTDARSAEDTIGITRH